MHVSLCSFALAAAGAFTPLPTAAQQSPSTGLVEATFKVCMAGVIQTSQAPQALDGLDWVATPRQDLPSSAIDAIAGRNLLNHFISTPVSSRWKSTWDTVRATAAGERRKIDIAGSEPATAFYTRKDDPSLLIVSLNSVGGENFKACELIVTPEVDQDFKETAGDTSRYPNPILGFERTPVGDGYVQVFGYDRARIEPAIEQEFPFSAYLQMRPK